MLRVSDLSVSYDGTEVIEHLSFELGRDEILMLVGPTGCGKTTILNAVAGLVPVAAGEIALAGWRSTPAKPVPPEARRLGMVFQAFALFPHLSVLQNVAFRARDPALADHWIERLGLSAFRDARPATLSGGQKQRVALARTLAHEPSLVLLDEPLSNLDEALKDDLRWEIRSSLKAASVPALWVTHDQQEALSVGDRVGVLRDGRLVQLATPEKCFAHPATAFVARFLGEAAFLEGRRSDDGAHAQTPIGRVPLVSCGASTGTDARIDVLFRPDDVAFATTTDDNATITSARFEGASWLYGLRLDCGSELELRANHEVRRQVGARVAVAACTHAPLAAFSATD